MEWIRSWIKVSEKEPPKDKDLFVCNTRQGNVMCVAWWSKAHNCWKGTGGQVHLQFTHWSLKPPPPDSQEGKK